MGPKSEIYNLNTGTLNNRVVAWFFENSKIKNLQIDRSIRNWLTKIVQLTEFEKNNFWAQKVKFTTWPNLTYWPFSHFSTFRGQFISNVRVRHIWAHETRPYAYDTTLTVSDCSVNYIFDNRLFCYWQWRRWRRWEN